jgi:hypothetical protein
VYKRQDKYSAILGNHIPEQVVPESPQAHGLDPIKGEKSDQLSDPVEFKDAPISFELDLNGRKIPVKLVEPEMDVSLPEGRRLTVKQDGQIWCDLRFAFNPESNRPYELHFKVLMGITYSADHRLAFGIPLEQDDDLLGQYKMEIVAKGGVRAWIRMTRGKARLVIKYQGPFH